MPVSRPPLASLTSEGYGGSQTQNLRPPWTAQAQAEGPWAMAWCESLHGVQLGLLSGEWGAWGWGTHSKRPWPRPPPFVYPFPSEPSWPQGPCGSIQLCQGGFWLKRSAQCAPCPLGLWEGGPSSLGSHRAVRLPGSLAPLPR